MDDKFQPCVAKGLLSILDQFVVDERHAHRIEQAVFVNSVDNKSDSRLDHSSPPCALPSIRIPLAHPCSAAAASRPLHQLVRRSTTFQIFTVGSLDNIRTPQWPQKRRRCSPTCLQGRDVEAGIIQRGAAAAFLCQHLGNARSVSGELAVQNCRNAIGWFSAQSGQDTRT